MRSQHRVLIVGGGFVGIKCALELAKKKPSNIHIRLVSDRGHFEYHGALYRLVTGRSPLEVCLPLRTIFKKYDVDVVNDRVTEIYTKEKSVEGKSGSKYQYDTLVLGLGSETNHFNIPGLEELSYSMKTIEDALELKYHIHDTINKCLITREGQELHANNYVVVGGGATGVEVAAELAEYTKELAVKNGVDPSFMTVELIEAQNRLLPMLPESFSAHVEQRLRTLGVNIYLNRRILEQELDEVELSGMTFKTKTVVWTAGVYANKLYKKLSDAKRDRQGRVYVDKYLRVNGLVDIFVGGDGAATVYAGMAQTALRQGTFIAHTILDTLAEEPLLSYTDKKPSYAIPIGPHWSATSIGPFTFYGRIGWWFRRVADFMVFISFLSFGNAVATFRSSKPLCDIDLTLVKEHEK